MNKKFEHKHLERWLQREREVSEQAKARMHGAIDYVVKNLPESTDPDSWYIVQEPFQHMKYREGMKVADWNPVYGVFDPTSQDPVRAAIDSAIRELK